MSLWLSATCALLLVSACAVEPELSVHRQALTQPPTPTKWRIRNASTNNGNWNLREIDFCADAACTQPFTGGTAIDSESSVNAVPSRAFDDDVGTFWKGFNSHILGAEWIGLDFGVSTDVKGLYMRTDNVVYHVDAIYVEYYDDGTGEWVTADIIDDIPAFSDVTYAVEVHSTLPVSWRIRNRSANTSTGEWIVREMDFCADAACTQPLGGTAIDSGSNANAVPANAFDDDFETSWEGLDAGVAGAEWIGMEFGVSTDVQGLLLRTESADYYVDSIYVEYYDLVTEQWIIADVIDDLPDSTQATYSVNIRPAPVAWRLRNAITNNGNWNLREIDFCADAACTQPFTGTAIDRRPSSNSSPTRAFDDDLGTFWKGKKSYVLGAEWIGMEFGTVTEVKGLYLRTDNVVYHVSSIYVEYYDLVTGQWVIADVLHNVPAFQDVTYSINRPSAHWTFDEGSGTTAASRVPFTDSATLYNGAAFTSPAAPIGIDSPYALSFDGVDDYALIPDSDAIDFASDEEFTVSVWIKPEAVQSYTANTANNIVEKWSGGGVGYPYVIRYYNQTHSSNNGKVFAGRYDGSNNPSVSSSVTINDGAYHHVVFVKRGTTLYLYVDGVLEDQTTDTTTGNTTNSSALNLGRRGNNTNYFEGAIDDLRIYDYGLSDAAVSALAP